MVQQGYSIILVWIPSYQGIVGNERADKAAKKAIAEGLDFTSEPVAIDNYKKQIDLHIETKWNNVWNNSKSSRKSVRPHTISLRIFKI